MIIRRFGATSLQPANTKKNMICYKLKIQNLSIYEEQLIKKSPEKQMFLNF